MNATGRSSNPQPEQRSVRILTRVRILVGTRIVRLIAHLPRRLGARCDSALAAAVFDARLVRPSRRTLDAALAARALVLLDRATSVSFSGLCILECTEPDGNRQLGCTMFPMVSDAASDPTALGRELGSARLAAGRSLRDAAGESEISAAYLQKLERGHVEDPSPRILRRLSDVLNLDYGRLMRLAGYEPPRRRRSTSPFEARLADARLTETEEKAVSAFIEHLIEQRGH